MITTERAQEMLEHGSDGPLTAFVLISRATKLATLHPTSHVEISNALERSLREFSWLRGEEEIVLHESLS